MSEEMAVYNPTLPTKLIPDNHELQVYSIMAKAAANTPFFKTLGGESGIISIMLYARELGIPPMQAITGGLHNIQGKIEMAARTINLKIRQAGHILRITHLDDTKCQIYGKRRDTGEEWEETYTIQDAKKAGLVKPGGGWEKNPSDMVFARCISRIGRRLFPDVIGTAYVEGEIREAMADNAPQPKKIARQEPVIPEPVDDPPIDIFDEEEPPTEQPEPPNPTPPALLTKKEALALYRELTEHLGGEQVKAFCDEAIGYEKASSAWTTEDKEKIESALELFIAATK